MGKEIYRRLSGDIINFIPFVDLITNFDYLTLQQYILNIIMFVPFGFLVPLTFKQYFDIKKISIISFVFSLFIELSQLAISCLWIGAGFRICDVNDLICNTLGGIFGYMILKGCLWILEGRKQKYEN